jgi:ABC-type antimicrobial peptide transport system permease subunit
MLYLMQRSKIKDRMDLVAVYRLLGIPKRDLMSIFAMESIFLTLRYALPSVAVAWALMQVASKISFFSAIAMYFPVWAAGITLVAIALYRLLVAILPVLHLLGQPPARLASKYDF